MKCSKNVCVVILSKERNQLKRELPNIGFKEFTARNTRNTINTKQELLKLKTVSKFIKNSRLKNRIYISSSSCCTPKLKTLHTPAQRWRTYKAGG